MDLNSSKERTIGEIISEANNLDASKVEEVLLYQKQHGVKFGEAAVALGFVGKDDVLWALSQQFHYPYSAQSNIVVSDELVVATNPFEESAEFFRDIRSKILQKRTEINSSKVALAVCSPSSGDGKSYFCANLAVAFSQLGARTLLVDADMRTPRQHEIFEVESSRSGLSGILSGRGESSVVLPIASLPSLFLLPVGVTPPNPLELVQSRAFDQLLTELLSKFEYVIVDTPAASHGADSRVIAGKCGSSLAIAKKSHTKSAQLMSLERSLSTSGSIYFGVVLNDF
jgi:protein-tyrosine kinase